MDMIVERSAGVLFRVTAHYDFEPAWIGVRVRRIGGEYVEKSARPELIRKAGCRVVRGAE
jgi:hypothetical protein